jgi:2-oxoglutarate ferredoxin oxidoreductase subunit alpha
MTETPLVVALVQRLGPSTGGATQGAQGDVLLAEFATSGGYTLPMLCPTNAQECYELTVLAFTWAELYRTPVIILSDKEVGMTAERVDYDALPKITSQDRPSLKRPASGDLQQIFSGTYFFRSPQDIPAFSAVGGEVKVTATGSAHDKRGKLQKNSPETIDVLLHLEEKLHWREQDLAVVDADLQEGAGTLVMSYGVTSRAAKEAVQSARDNGGKVSFLGIHSLFPVPKKKIAEAIRGVDRILVAEENMKGLYRSVIERYCGGKRVAGVNKVGSMITPKEIASAISSLT